MDSAGRIVIPKSIREQSSLKAGSSLEISYRGGLVVLEPAPLDVELVQEKGVLVARPTSDVEILTDDLVNHTLDSIRGRQA
jgi:AbrB family looped-hinge helix DNA binding protein